MYHSKTSRASLSIHYSQVLSVNIPLWLLMVYNIGEMATAEQSVKGQLLPSSSPCTMRSWGAKYQLTIFSSFESSHCFLKCISCGVPSSTVFIFELEDGIGREGEEGEKSVCVNSESE